MRSADGGQTWNDLVPGFSVIANNVHVVDAQNIFVYESGFRNLYKSTDAGASWKKLGELPAPGNGSYRYYMQFSSAENGYVSAFDMNAKKTYFYKTSNGGTSWRLIYSDLSNEVSYFIRNQTELVLHSANGKRHIMDSSGKVVAIGDADKFLSHFASNASNRFAIARDDAGDFYVYTTEYSALGTTEKLQAKISDLQVYPNPATGGEINLYYALSNHTVVSVSITDLSGKLFYSETLGNQPAGNHSTQINTNSFAKGFYLLQLTNTAGTITKKLVIQ